MIFSIDITECFGVIDSDNAGGIISCISIPPIENPQEKFRLKLSNFVLNLIDEPLIDSINRQNSTFLENMTEHGFLIIRQACISFESIKGYEKLLRLSNQDHGYLTHERYGKKLNTGDKIYDISGRIFSTPELLINFAFISPNTITLEFNSSDYTYIESYPEFQKALEKLNSIEKSTQPPLTGIFDSTYSNTHTTSNFDAGYRIYNQ
ncbi:MULTISPECIES: hypothetical protein [unclassified Pseudomonas]|uniref:hypothetical protein n=1 Tax=unclassified Pseudomonas TaxID=196821 RepID=UPI000C880B18|nr:MULTISPECIES: hypothetical protein [unclassified Pseudomonas]PNA05653.1 hypothetical protein C1X28_08840 [Pseudomonas sp. FW305-BF15]PNB77336.1 hypothetical protein C1X30_28950 [Pseudomonas sp. FW305-BF6]